jgi:hypothetical protein
MKQDLTQILTSGVFELRRAWKIYSNLQKYLFNLYKILEPNAEDIYGTDPNKLPDVVVDENDAKNDDDADIGVSTLVGFELSLNSVKSLLASASFGYGIIQLCFSFFQPSVLKLLKFIGKFFFDKIIQPKF